MELSPEAFHAAVHRTFRELAAAEPGRIVVVDAERAAAEVSACVLEVVSRRLARIGPPPAAPVRPPA
jgi:thymidylate kinase